MARVVSPSRVSSSPLSPVATHADFYRAEFTRHRQCLAAMRECFSESAITDADAALARILNQLEQLCAKDDAEQVIAGLLRKFNAVTGLHGWSDPSQLH
jgi:hypothetical protein